MKCLLFLLLIALALAACSPVTSSNRAPAALPAVSNITPTPTDDPALIPTLFPNNSAKGDLTRIDEQGMVVMEVTPLNLGTPADTLEFDIAMNTHSVNLSMDLAMLSTLSTDTGVSVQPDAWDAPLGGGHHVSGKLIFPATKDGTSILDGAGKIMLSIRDVDAPLRLFEWVLK